MGKFTRLAQFFGPLPKTYTGAIRFGFATDTYDAEGIPAAPADMAPIAANHEIQAAAAHFRGRGAADPARRSPPKKSMASRPTRRPGAGETVVLEACIAA